MPKHTAGAEIHHPKLRAKDTAATAPTRALAIILATLRALAAMDSVEVETT